MYKLLLFLVILLGLGALAGAAWGSQAAPARVLTEKDTGRTVTLRVGERLTLNLRNPAGGGYTVVTPVFDQRVLKLLSRETQPPEAATPPQTADFGRLVFHFEAAAPGDTDLTVKISREWEKGKPPLDYVKLRVRVVP